MSFLLKICFFVHKIKCMDTALQTYRKRSGKGLTDSHMQVSNKGHGAFSGGMERFSKIASQSVKIFEVYAFTVKNLIIRIPSIECPRLWQIMIVS